MLNVLATVTFPPMSRLPSSFLSPPVSRRLSLSPSYQLDVTKGGYGFRMSCDNVMGENKHCQENEAHSVDDRQFLCLKWSQCGFLSPAVYLVSYLWYRDDSNPFHIWTLLTYVEILKVYFNKRPWTKCESWFVVGEHEGTENIFIEWTKQ